jgi:hypothetical protein
MLAVMSPGAAPAGAKSRVRSRGWLERMAAASGCFVLAGAVLAVSLAAGCSTPVVAAQAVWIGEDRDADGSRTLFAYGAGTITSSALRPLSEDPDAGQLPMLVELEPRGRGVLIRGMDAGWLHELGDGMGLRAGYLDLSRRRALPLWLPATRLAVDGARFSNSGDALMWVEDCEVAVLPLVAGLPLDSEQHGAGTTIAPLRRTFGAQPGKPAPRSACATEQGTLELASAADAPRIFVVEADAPGSASGAARTGARLEALRVPVAADEPATLELLAQSRLPEGFTPVWLFAARCPGSAPCGLAAADPDGTALFIAGGGSCLLMRWEVETGEQQCVHADVIPALNEAQLVAAISSEEVVLRDTLALHRWNWRTGELVSRPLPAASGGALYVRPTPDGRAVVALATRGPLLRASAEGIELVNVEQHACRNPQAPVLAPDGRSAAWTCVVSGDTTVGEEAGLAVGEVIRASAAGLEVFQGVQMWALAIDDAGDLLLASRRTPDFSQETQLPAQPPGNLYVLSGAGVLERIDGLEPNPELMLGLVPGTYRWIHARSL